MAGLDRSGLKESYLRVLSEGEVERIHQGSMKILAGTGVVINHSEVRALLDDAGCQIDHATGLTKIPPTTPYNTIDGSCSAADCSAGPPATPGNEMAQPRCGSGRVRWLRGFWRSTSRLRWTGRPAGGSRLLCPR